MNARAQLLVPGHSAITLYTLGVPAELAEHIIRKAENSNLCSVLR